MRPMPTFPRIISLTLTGNCNLRCKMCGQRRKNGCYQDASKRKILPVAVWKRALKEISNHQDVVACIRGGEPLLYPGIIELISYAKKRGIFVSIDTNGTLLTKYAEALVKAGVDNINVSVDGPEKIHDSVRGVRGSFRKLSKGIKKIKEIEKSFGKQSCIRTIVFTISPYSYRGLAAMPATARNLGVPSIALVPYFFFDKRQGKACERIMKKALSCEAVSWKGFFRESSGIDTGRLVKLLKRFRKGLRGVKQSPFMKFTDSQYRLWFEGGGIKTVKRKCLNPWRLADIQPNGDVNFCVDFPDYALGNIKDNTIEDMWNGSRAGRFRKFIMRGSLPLCARCGARYI